MPNSSKNQEHEMLHRFLFELEWCSTKKYVELLRGRGDLIQIGSIDVDVPQIVQRHFFCDAQRCLQWSGQTLLVDRSCCCRYDIPLTERDRAIVLKHLPQVRPNLPPTSRLQDPEADPFELNEDFSYEMVQDNPLGGCQFNLYIDGHCRCALHSTALRLKENPHDWKPIACSLWPLALNSYTDEDEDRLLLTIYCPETMNLFDETDDEPFACIVDQKTSYPRMYQSEKTTLEFLFGASWWRELDAAAQKILRHDV